MGMKNNIKNKKKIVETDDLKFKSFKQTTSNTTNAKNNNSNEKSITQEEEGSLKGPLPPWLR